jgi:hypothetical protein
LATCVGTRGFSACRCSCRAPTRAPRAPPPGGPWAGIFQYVSGDANLEGASLWFQGHDPFQFRLVNPDWVDTQGDTFDITEEGYYWTSGSSLTLDVTKHSPPGYVDLYTFGPGENELAFSLQAGYLTLSGESWQTGKQWATEWTASEYAPIVGQYWFQSSQEASLDSFWSGATLELDSDFSFDLANPVGATATVSESGTYERDEANITFSVETREGDVQYYTFPENTAVVAYSEFSLSLQLALEHNGLSDPSAIWTQGEKEWWKSEAYENDDPSSAQALAGTWYYEVHGNLSSGGIDGQGYYDGDYDFYALIPSAGGTVSIVASWPSGADIDLILYDDSVLSDTGTEPLTYAASYDNPEYLTFSLTAGERYYLLVVSYDNPSDYLLSIDVP